MIRVPACARVSRVSRVSEITHRHTFTFTPVCVPAPPVSFYRYHNTRLLPRKMEDSLAVPLIDAIATAHVPTDRSCPTRHLAIAPPYDWSRTYMAAKDMEEYLPGVPLDATLVEATEDGFDVLASDGVTSLVHVVVERRRHQPLRPGDPVVATVAGVGLEGDLLREGRPGEWVVLPRVRRDQSNQ